MCTVSQYIAEVLILRKAEKDNKGNLPYKFWNTEKRKKSYQGEITAVSRAIQQFGADIVLSFINSDKGKRIYSFGFFHVRDFIKDMLLEFSENYKPPKVIIEEAPKEKLEITTTVTPTFKKSKSFVSKLSKLEKNSGENKD